MLTTPGGNPAWLSRSPNRSAVRGVISEGLRTTVLPVASAGPNFHAAITCSERLGTWPSKRQIKRYQRGIPGQDASLEKILSIEAEM